MTTKPFAVTSTPVLAVTIPTESILVTSSYVKTPPIVAAPLTLISTAESKSTLISGVPPKLNAVFANETVVPAPRVVIPVTFKLLNVVPPVTLKDPPSVVLPDTSKLPVISPEIAAASVSYTHLTLPTNREV